MLLIADYQFWTTTIISVVYLGIGIYGVYLQRQQLGSTPSKGKRNMNSSSPFSRLMWAVMICLALINWLPFALTKVSGTSIQTSVRHGSTPTQDGFPATSQKPLSEVLGIAPGPTRMNLGVVNFGPLPAKDVRMKAKIFWSSKMNTTAELDEWKKFMKEEAYSGSTDLDVGQNSWKTYESGAITDRDAKDIKDNQRFLYSFLEWEYADNGGSHSTEECRRLQLPLSDSGIIWQGCDRGHTKIK